MSTMSIRLLVDPVYVGLLVTLLSAGVSCQTGTSQANTPAEAASKEERVAIRGIVIDNAGAGWPGLTVEVRATSGQKGVAKTMVAKTDKDGQFSVNLNPGSYKICVSRFPNSCHELSVEAGKTPEYLSIHVGTDYQHVTEEEFEGRIRELAGAGAKDCGRVLSQDGSKNATRCAYAAYKSRKAFFVRYDGKGIGDSITAHALVSDKSRKAYSVGYDSGSLDVSVTPCSQPLRLRVSRITGELICFGGDYWLGDE